MPAPRGAGLWEIKMLHKRPSAFGATSRFRLTITCAPDGVERTRSLVAGNLAGARLTLRGVRCRQIEADRTEVEIEIGAARLPDSWLACLVELLGRERGVRGIDLSYAG